MIDETIGNLNFLKETIGKFKNEIQKFIADPDYVNHNAITLRQSIEELEKNILNKEKNIAGQILNNNNSKSFLRNNQNESVSRSTLPNIYDSLRYVKKS